MNVMYDGMRLDLVFSQFLVIMCSVCSGHRPLFCMKFELKKNDCIFLIKKCTNRFSLSTLTLVFPTDDNISKLEKHK